MKVAIMGAHGMVGARVLESFRLGDGPSVVAVVQTSAQLALPARFAVDLRVADPLDLDSLVRSFTGCVAAIHLEQELAPSEGRALTIFCRAAAQAGLRRLIFLSSAAVHGQNPPAGTDENSTLHQRHSLSANNQFVAAERQFFAECRQLGLSGFALRPAVLYGPRSRFIAGLVENLIEDRAWVLQRGEGVCNSLYVDNLVAAIRLCLKARKGAGFAYLLRDAEAVTWQDVYRALVRELNLPSRNLRLLEPSFSLSNEPAPRGSDVPWEVPHAPGPEIAPELAMAQECAWRLPYKRAMHELGYQPGVSFAEGMRRTCAWWRFAHPNSFAAA